MSSPPPGRALVSVSGKRGLADLGRGLHRLGVEVLSTGGTARALGEAAVPVTRVSDYTGFPEILDGRVKTLHPKIFGGILGRRALAPHREEMARQGIAPIDLVVVNLYPFARTIARPEVTLAEAVEQIDIGGPSLIRAAAKNFAEVLVVVDPDDYPALLARLAAGEVDDRFRRRLAAKAFRHTADYDARITEYLDGEAPGTDRLPDRLALRFEKVQDLRYGENPHQAAAFFAEPDAPPSSLVRGEQVQGKALSFNNLLDLDAAWALVSEFRDADQVFCAVLKHTNPCGAALGATPGEAFERALAVDPTSAFGGIIGFNREVDGPAAERIAEAFYECIIAPGFSAAAWERLSGKKNLRLLAMPAFVETEARWDYRRVHGGLLVQGADTALLAEDRLTVVTRRAPTGTELRGLRFAWTLVKHVKSNAIVYARADRLVGVGAGQMSRVDAARIGAEKAQAALEGTVLASDAFFPFRDGIDAAATHGVTAVIQPGGSIRDAEVIAAADEHGMAMLCTGLRHFRH